MRADSKQEAYEKWRKVMIRDGARMRVYRRDVDRLRAAFADKSYALVERPAPGFVPLVLRHMTNEDFAALFWREPTLIVIDGKPAASSLCELCPNMLACYSDGRDIKYGFQCRPAGTAIRDNAAKRKKGARH